VLRSLVVLALLGSPAHADLVHRTTLPDLRAVSLAYDPYLCAVWVADETATVRLISTAGQEVRRFDSGMRMVRSLTVERDGLLLANGWGDFRRVDRQGRNGEETFELSEAVRDTEGFHRDADGSFLVVEDDPSRLLRIAPDGSVRMHVQGRPPEAERCLGELDRVMGQNIEHAPRHEAAIIAELAAAQGAPADIGGYYHPDPAKLTAVMRPSATLNGILG